MKKNKGFTLIELLTVIGILAVLVVAVVIIINPTERARAARDAKRVEDLNSIQSAIELAMTQDSSLSLGDPNVVYTSLLASNSDCFDLNLPTLPTGMSYRCVTSEGNLRKTDGSGWLPVNLSNIGAIGNIPPLPLDPVNLATKKLYYLYVLQGALYKLQGLVESMKYLDIARRDGGRSSIAIEKGSNVTLSTGSFPDGWIRVPGNSILGTSDFWVMQYEAKYDTDGNGVGNDAATCTFSQASDTWDWGRAGIDCPTTWTGNSVVSSAEGSVIANITPDEADSACEAGGSHVITNAEWMTIARNIEQQPQNWTGGSVGSGCIFMGQSSNYICGYSEEGSKVGKGVNRDPKVKLRLSNSLEIWDFAGNASERVKKDISTNAVYGGPKVNDDNRWLSNINFTSLTSYGQLGYDGVRPSDPSWDDTKGVGKMGMFFDGSTGGGMCMYRGGASVGETAGVYSMNLGYPCSSPVMDSHVGFRCVKSL